MATFVSEEVRRMVEWMFVLMKLGEPFVVVNNGTIMLHLLCVDNSDIHHMVGYTQLTLVYSTKRLLIV